MSTDAGGVAHERSVQVLRQASSRVHVVRRSRTNHPRGRDAGYYIEAAKEGLCRYCAAQRCIESRYLNDLAYRRETDHYLAAEDPDEYEATAWLREAAAGGAHIYQLYAELRQLRGSAES